MPFVIYCCTNRVNGKRYVGQTRQTQATRWAQHVSDALRGVDTRFYRAIRKYGREGFVREVLESVASLEAANEAEQKWIRFFQSTDPQFGYNLDEGGNVRGVSPETRAKQSEAQKKRFSQPGAKEKLAASTRGRSLSPEHKAKLSAVRIGHTWMRGVKHQSPQSEEHRAKIAAARRGRKHSPETRAKMAASQKASRLKAKEQAPGSLLMLRPSQEEMEIGPHGG